MRRRAAGAAAASCHVRRWLPPLFLVVLQIAAWQPPSRCSAAVAHDDREAVKSAVAASVDAVDVAGAPPDAGLLRAGGGRRRVLAPANLWKKCPPPDRWKVVAVRREGVIAERIDLWAV